MSDAFSSRLAEQIALRGYGAVQASHPLLENALSQCASLSASPDTVRRLASECGAEKKKSPELFEGAVEVKDGRTCVFYRGDGSFYSSSDEFDELHKSQRECFKELVAMGLNVAQSLGLTSFDGVSVEELMQPENSYTSLAYQISPSNALVPRHIDAAALTLVVLPPEDTQLHLLPDGISCVTPSDPLSSLRRPDEPTVKVVAFPGQLVSLDGQSNLYPVPHFVRASQVPRSSLVLRLYPPSSEGVIEAVFDFRRESVSVLFPHKSKLVPVEQESNEKDPNDPDGEAAFWASSRKPPTIMATPELSANDSPGPKVYLRAPIGITFQLPFQPDETVLSLKQRLSELEGSPVDDIGFIFASKLMKNEQLLGDYDLQPDSTISVSYRMRGD